ncbi:hypothetical protein E4T38_09480 [Aureobasidium subglaciale]|nr:hypothetical protein E4T38_09480 [Aureobasidium subglaciale]KAI5213880.1 hypothetical protein E4T40_09431 [Aureobasidium subglaciale]KAI5215848.1 hypothetical protein E4T41_09432 [Aureobasidium subglaciale]KAI5253925.1 hypothetical protein E4T46_09387 [Aureobasidium subglaciale]
MSDDVGMHGEFGQPLSPVASGSKRKRTMEWAMEVPEADVRLPLDQHSSNPDQGQHDQDNNLDRHERHTPKRSRPSPSPTSKQQPRSIRRKDARYGLSSLNRRHAEAEAEAELEAVDVHITDSTRPSRFQEGSMSDKPSAQPPSVFTRDHSNPGMPALANVDHLMTQYHEENSTPSAYHTLKPSVSYPLQRTVGISPQHTASHPLQHDSIDPPRPVPTSVPTFDSIAPSTTASVKPAGGFFRFGKMVASTFNPANVWESFSRTWKESKEDLTVRNIEENRKLAQSQSVQDDKAMYEQAYQELKKSGQFNFTVVPNKALTSPRIGANSQFNSPIRQPLTSPRHAAAYAHLRPDADFPQSRDNSLDLADDSAAPPQLATLFKRDSNLTVEPKSPTHLSPEKPLSKRKSFFTLRGASLRAPSLTSLKRGRSVANLSDTFGRTSEDKRTPSASPEKPAVHNLLTLQSLPRSQTKRDLNKTVKLNKRVSDLESKLADARRELNQAITNASPLPVLPSRFERFTPTSKSSKFGRARFGLSSSRLPSLPSESLLQAETIAQAQDTPSLVRPRPAHSQSFDLTHLRDSAQQRDSVIIVDTPRSEIQSFLPIDFYDSAPMDPAAIASSEVGNQSETEDRPSLDAKLSALEASHKQNVKKTPSKKRKSAAKDDGIYKPPADEEEDELEIVKEKLKKKRKSTSKKAATVKPANDQPETDVGHGKKNKTNTKKQESSKQHATEQVQDVAPIGRSSLDTLDPINEEDNIVFAPRVDSTMSLVPSQHDSAISATDAEAIHVRTDPLKSILVNKYETARPTSRGSNKRRSSSQHRSSSPPFAAYQKPSLVAIEKHHIVTATPGVGSVPALPTSALEKATEQEAGAGITKEQYEWPEDVF